MKKTLYQLFLLSSLILLLSGCGFHLRNQQSLPPQLHMLYVTSNHPYNALSKQLQQTLRAIGVVLTSNAQDAPFTLQILNDNLAQNLTSQGSSGQLATYQLVYSVKFQLLDHAGQVIQTPITIYANRNYAVSSNQILGDSTVQGYLQNSMRQDVIEQILDRLRARDIQRTLQNI